VSDLGDGLHYGFLEGGGGKVGGTTYTAMCDTDFCVCLVLAVISST
jgi:hypothetical protein